MYFMKCSFNWLFLVFVCFSSCVSKKRFTSAEQTIAGLRTQNRELRDQATSLKDRLQLMEEANQYAAIELNEKDQALVGHRQDLEDKERKLQQLQELIGQQKRQREALREKMAKALGNFNADQLSVFSKNGKVYVRLSEQLLFPSGSATLSSEGKNAIAQLAVALNEHKDIHLNIEGHTDSVPIKFKFADNWELGTERATAIVRLLINEFEIDPIRITASTRSQYEPIAENSTEEGRAKNRRTEIILAPKLDELMQLLDSNDID